MKNFKFVCYHTKPSSYIKKSKLIVFINNRLLPFSEKELDKDRGYLDKSFGYSNYLLDNLRHKISKIHYLSLIVVGIFFIMIIVLIVNSIIDLLSGDFKSFSFPLNSSKSIISLGYSFL